LPKVIRAITYTWQALNRLLKHTHNEKVLLRIYAQQRALPPEAWEGGATQRDRWLRRIWSRYARLRARRERKEVAR
jgi:hypothetical protein